MKKPKGCHRGLFKSVSTNRCNSVLLAILNAPAAGLGCMAHVMAHGKGGFEFWRAFICTRLQWLAECADYTMPSMEPEQRCHKNPPSPAKDMPFFLWIQSHFYINKIIQLQHPLQENQLFFLLPRKQCKGTDKVSCLPLTLQSSPLSRRCKSMCHNLPYSELSPQLSIKKTQTYKLRSDSRWKSGYQQPYFRKFEEKSLNSELGGNRRDYCICNGIGAVLWLKIH